MTETIPRHLINDRYWKPVLYLFIEHDKLNLYFTDEYFDFEECTIKIQKLKNKSKVWSKSERFMLNLALHLYNESNKVNLSDMDYLDENNLELAMAAIRMRFK